jgi:N-hydroxyarylamine O-acetyltransferase
MRLHEYLARLGLDGGLRPDADGLRRVHAAHREAFLFENISIQTGGAISVAVEDIERKFLDEGRGGYCFEHNTLFAAALADLGFQAVTLLGRVRRGPPERWCRTHMVLEVRSTEVRSTEVGSTEVGSTKTFLADVGFGAIGIVEPIPLEDSASSLQGGLLYRLRRERELWVLSVQDANGLVTDLYEFSEDPQTPGDVAVANHFTSTHPDSIFRRTLTIQKSRMDDRVALSSLSLTRHTRGRMTTEPVDRSKLRELARGLAGVTLPDGPFLFEEARPVSIGEKVPGW